jgi:hypothetical protein
MIKEIKLLSQRALLLVLLGSCKKDPVPNCLPYEGKIIDASPCGGTIVEVMNRDISSKYYLPSQEKIIPNAMGVRFPDSVTIDRSRTIYSEFRELTTDEIFPCPALFSAPSRQVAITRFSYERCAEE